MTAARWLIVAAGLATAAGCGGYSAPAELRAVKGDWIADGPDPMTFRVLILDPVFDREFNWYEWHDYRGGVLADGSSGNFKYEPGKLFLKRPVGTFDYDIVATGGDALTLRTPNGPETKFRPMSDADYARVDWSVSKVNRLKDKYAPGKM